MALKDSEIHVVAAVATPLLSGLLGVLFVLSTSSQRGCDSEPEKPELDKYTVVEASLAMKKEKKATQPQKPIKRPEETKKEGVSHDETKKPEKKKDEPKKVDNKKTPDITDFHHAKPPDDTPESKAPQTQGDFNGAANGNALVSKGDPYIGRLAADMGYTVPPIAECDGTPPLACIKLSAQGKVVETKIKAPSNKPCLNSAAEEAIKRIKKARDDSAEEVPTHLLASLTENGICFRPTAN